MLDVDDLVALADQRLRDDDAARERDYPGDRGLWQPVHTVYVPADRLRRTTVGDYRDHALGLLAEHDDLFREITGADDRVVALVRDKLRRQPIEDLRADFEDGYGVRPDADEDKDVRKVTQVFWHLHAEEDSPGRYGVRFKSLEAPTRRRGIQTLARTLDQMRELVGDDELVVTLPKVTSEAQVQALVAVLERLEKQVSSTSRGQRFEIQVETPQTVLGPDGSALVARMIRAGGRRLSGLHYGTYDYSAFLGLAAGDQSLEHPAADHAKAVMQAAAAGTGVELSDGSTNVLPVGDGLRLGWETHHRLVTRALHRGFYQGWDLHPAQLPTRFAATFQFFRAGAADADARLVAYAANRTGAIADEPATVRALADYLLRGLDCGALTDDEVSLGRGDLARLARRREGS